MFMRNVIKFVGVFVPVFLILCSCTKETRLSCDPFTNSWAKGKVSYYEEVGRDELLKLSLSEQRAIINGLSGQKRVSLWNEKLEIVKQEKSLSNEELLIFEEIIDYIKPYHFEESSKAEELLAFTEEKLKTLYTKYGWDEEKEFFYLHTWLTESEYNDAFLFEITQTSSGQGYDDDDNTNPNQNDCKCMPYRLECSAGMICVEGNCKTVKGCGLFNQKNCTGTCQF